MFNSLLENIPSNFQSFTELNIIHRIADRLFIEHQIACMSCNWEEALNAMEIMYEIRMQMIQDAEGFLLPLYQSVVKDIPQGGAVKFFMREHQRIRKNLDSFVRNISNIVLYNSGDDVNLVELFESYHAFKDLLDHHDARERVFLYKLLEEKMDIENWISVLQEISLRWAKKIDEIGVPV